MSHRCHAVGCPVEVPPKMLMCLRHWRLVPTATQEAVWAEYRPGQEADKKPSLVYMGVQQVAVGQVAEKEGKLEAAAECFAHAVSFLVLAKRAGEAFKNPEHARALNQRLMAENTVQNIAAALGVSHAAHRARSSKGSS